MARRLLASVLVFVVAGCSSYEIIERNQSHSAAGVCGDLAVFVTEPLSQFVALGMFDLFETRKRPGCVTAVNLRTGEVAWRYQGGHDLSSEPPVIDGTTAYVLQDGRPCAIDCLTGKQRWYGKHEPGREEGSLFVAGKAVVCNGFDERGKDWGLFAYDKDSGRPLWTRVRVDFVGQADGRIFCFQRSSDTDLHAIPLFALNAETGERLWETQPFPTAVQPVAGANEGGSVARERWQRAAAGGWLGVGAAEGARAANERAVAVVGRTALSDYGCTYMVRCFDAVTGQLLWSKDVPVRFENRGPTDAVLLVAGPRCWIFTIRPIQIGNERTGEEMWFRVCDLLTGEDVREGRVEFAPCFPPLLMSGDGAPQVVLTYLPAEEPLGVLAFDAETGRLLRQFSLPEESEIAREFWTFSVWRNTLFAGGYQHPGWADPQPDDFPYGHPIPVLYQFDLGTGDVLWSLIGKAKPPR